MLKILIDARMLGPQIHGIARYVKDLIQGLSEKGFEISIITHSGLEKNLIGKNFITSELKCHAPFASPFEALALSLLDYKKFDLVHFPSFSVPMRFPPNGIVTIHDLIHLYPPSKLSHQIYFKGILKPSLRHALGIITVSQWTKRELSQYLNINLEKITVVRNGIRDSLLVSSLDSNKGITLPNSPYFICVTNSKPHKNLITLINACKALWKSSSQFKLVIVSDLEKAPSEWPLNSAEREQIIFFSKISDVSLTSLLSNAKALVSPSLFEGFNYPAAESLALGVPVILSRGSAHDEMNLKGSCIYGDPKDDRALSKMLSEFLTSSSTVATENPPRFEDMISETIKVYYAALKLQSNDFL
jgi:glycosyltransferase involved in cell wall biosynthesis